MNTITKVAEPEETQMNQIRQQLILILFSIISTALATQASHATHGAPTIAELKNATYTGIEDVAVTLSNGHWEGPPWEKDGASIPQIDLAGDMHFTGDLDGDGEDETAAILWQNSGGTGNNVYIAVMNRENGGVTNIATVLVGDRVRIRGGEITDGKITLRVLQAGKGDGMCCPTMLATRNWSLSNGQLIEGEIEDTGKLSISILEGSQWLLTHLDRNKPLAEGTEVTLDFSGEQISGKSACNRYSAGIEQGEAADEIKIGQSMSTMMACPDELMKIEREFLALLSRVTGFSFHAGRLELSGNNEDETPFSLLFKPGSTE